VGVGVGVGADGAGAGALEGACRPSERALASGGIFCEMEAEGVLGRAGVEGAECERVPARERSE
jgi:hypothetical protein